MRIGDIEYTRGLTISTAAANSSVRGLLNYALGIKIRPLLTRVQCFIVDAGAGTGGQGIFLENGTAIDPGITLAALAADLRSHPLYISDQALSTNGMAITRGFESTWWKILMPDVRIHAVSTVLAAMTISITLHYRFAELTDDEIIEIAAQRAQS